VQHPDEVEVDDVIIAVLELVELVELVLELLLVPAGQVRIPGQ